MAYERPTVRRMRELEAKAQDAMVWKKDYNALAAALVAMEKRALDAESWIANQPKENTMSNLADHIAEQGALTRAERNKITGNRKERRERFRDVILKWQKMYTDLDQSHSALMQAGEAQRVSIITLQAQTEELTQDKDDLLKIIDAKDKALARANQNIDDLVEACRNLEADRAKPTQCPTTEQLRAMQRERNEARNKLALAETKVTLLLEALEPFSRDSFPDEGALDGAKHTFKSCSPEVQVAVDRAKGPDFTSVRSIKFAGQGGQLTNIQPITPPAHLSPHVAFARDMERRVREVTGVSGTMMGGESNTVVLTLGSARGMLLELSSVLGRDDVNKTYARDLAKRASEAIEMAAEVVRGRK